ncbi:MAG: trypsin-like peptidase domain-containing protein [Pirellulales bacterium]|nr:trypsin-like peptidase domain-containing protein [Pirellulales bacterium]
MTLPASAAPDAAVLEIEARRVATIDRIKPAVLAIFDASGRGGGSGVVISPDGFALSNFHVAAPCGPAMKCGMADGKVYDAVVVGLDPTGDVALLKLFGRDDFPAATLGDSDALQLGDEVFALGNPFLLATDLQPTVTCGIVSGLRRYQYPAGTFLEYTDCIQTDASINPGNSGGPLFDADGRLVGINGRASFEKRGRVNVGAAYAISINQIKNFLGQLRSGRIVDHASLGATAAGAEGGAVAVTDILETSDAFRRGLRYDDEIVRLAGREITTANGLKNVLGILPAGWRVPLSYRRDGRRFDVLVRLPRLHGKEELLKAARAKPPETPMPLPPPDRKPKDRKTPPDQSKPPIPVPKKASALKPPAPMPPVVKQHYEEKRGFANYYFNRSEQQRLWRAWNGSCNLAGQNGVWTLAGLLGDGVTYQLELADDQITLKLPSQTYQWIPRDNLAEGLTPRDGLLAAIYLWRRLAVEGFSRFGGVYYLGTAPLPGHEGLVDVLVGSYKGVEGHFYFDPQGGQLLALEMFPEENDDPYEIRFSEYRDVDGRKLPGRLEALRGDVPLSTLTVSEYRFGKPRQEDAGKGGGK